MTLPTCRASTQMGMPFKIKHLVLRSTALDCILNIKLRLFRSNNPHHTRRCSSSHRTLQVHSSYHPFEVRSSRRTPKLPSSQRTPKTRSSHHTSMARSSHSSRNPRSDFGCRTVEPAMLVLSICMNTLCSITALSWGFSLDLNSTLLNNWKCFHKFNCGIISAVFKCDSFHRQHFPYSSCRSLMHHLWSAEHWVYRIWDEKHELHLSRLDRLSLFVMIHIHEPHHLHWSTLSAFPFFPFYSKFMARNCRTLFLLSLCQQKPGVLRGIYRTTESILFGRFHSSKTIWLRSFLSA